MTKAKPKRRIFGEMLSLHTMLLQSQDEEAETLAAVLEIEIMGLDFLYDRMYHPEKFTAAQLEEERLTPEIIETVRLAFG